MRLHLESLEDRVVPEGVLRGQCAIAVVVETFASKVVCA